MLSIDHVQIAAPSGCEAAARTFFVDLLGLTQLPKQGETAASGGAWFSTGTVQLHVGVTTDFTPAGKAHVALRTATPDHLHALAAVLSHAGHPVRWDTRLPGILRFFTADPWGN
ncbi:MAG: catechol 2,3-dioxygenase-like lactoylglutathione lyase family enzyme, partial [Myxococcota bacterium]